MEPAQSIKLQTDDSSSSSASDDDLNTGMQQVALGLFQLSDSIRMFKNKPISSRTNIFHGEQVSDITDLRPLAIKFIPYDEKNVREAKLLLKLRSHPNVVSIVHSGITEQGAFKYVYIAMELCHEQNLYDHVTANKNNNVPFDPQLSIFQAKQLVEGLSYIHSNNVIHRDLKPHNVLLSLDKKSLKIAVFRTSKPMTSELTKTKVTNVGAGTDGYRAPEAFNNDEISQKADIYSLGLIFYFLWSNGHHPFGEDPVGWNYKIETNQRYDLSKLLVSDKEMATDLLQWMLQFEAVNRPTTAQIFSHKLFGESLVSPEAVTSLKEKSSASTSSLKETTEKMRIDGQNQAQKMITEPVVSSRARSKLPSASDVGPGTSGVQQARRVSELEDQAEKMIEIEDKAKHYFDKGQYQIAEGYLKKLVDLQKDPWEKLETLQQIAECHVMLDQPCVNDINNIISTGKSLQISPDDIKSTADKHLEDSHLVRAYVMFVCASTMYRSCDEVVRIRKCTRSMENIVEAMKNQPRLQMIASSQVISSMYYMLEQLREIKKVPVDLKVNMEAACLNSIGVSHARLCEYNKALDNYNKAMQIMQRKFGSNSVKYQLFGILLNNIGLANTYLHNNPEALRYYQQSIDAYQKAEDFPTEEVKQESIEMTKNDLRICQNK